MVGGWGGGGVGWYGMHSHFHVQPNCSVEVVLCFVVVDILVFITLVYHLDNLAV